MIKINDLLSYKGQNVITPWDRLKAYMFETYPIVKLTSLTDEEIMKAAISHQGISPMIWVVDESAWEIKKDFPWHYRVSNMEFNFVHEFPRVVKRTGTPVAWGDVRLVPTSGVWHGVLQNKIIGSYNETDFDVVMISFHEAEADRNFVKLKKKFPDAKHVKNVDGIANAHKKAAEQAKSQMVYIVDADADIMDDFDFDFIPPIANRDNTTYVWYARNPINDLEYGYGAVKLFPKQQLLDMGHELPDFSAGVSFYQPVRDVSNITRFNRDPYRTWRSAFRECVKLSSGIQQSNTPSKETVTRLETWTTVDNGERFGRYCIKGALAGKLYGEEHANDLDALNKINDFEWLREQFVESMKKKTIT